MYPRVDRGFTFFAPSLNFAASFPMGPSRTNNSGTGKRKKPGAKEIILDAKLDALQDVQKQAIETHKHSTKTRDDYNSARKRAIKWLHDACKSGSEESIVRSHPDFAQSFEGEPKECSGVALGLYITLKCFHEGCGRSTAEVIHAAMKKYWEEL